jgi:hypothetical protein
MMEKKTIGYYSAESDNITDDEITDKSKNGIRSKNSEYVRKNDKNLNWSFT